MANNQRYPLSTTDGQAIPLEVINPKGIVRIPFDNLLGSQLFTIPVPTELISVFTSAECIISFNKIAALPADNTYIPDTIHVPRSVGIVFAPPSLHLSIIGLQGAGVAMLQIHEPWAGLALAQQYKRK